MRAFYEAVRDADPQKLNMATTVIEGDSVGEKAVFSGGDLIWVSRPDGFIARHAGQLGSVAETGLVRVDGVRVFAEQLGREKKLVVCGGGHVAIPVIKLARMLGFYVTVVEDRAQFAENARRAGANEVLCQPFGEALAGIEGDNDTYFAVITRGHKNDEACLQQIVRKPHAYAGMIGSARHGKLVRDALLASGADPNVVAAIYTPIGLAIGAETPEEIAVSIMAEIIEVKNKTKRNDAYPKDIMRAVLSEDEASVPRILATIVKRHGSAPRGVGSKMIVYPDGHIVGTVGGGSGEAGIMRIAGELLKEPPQTVVRHLVLDGNDAAARGMICGGDLDVLLERV